jgi:hypothetical protein
MKPQEMEQDCKKDAKGRNKQHTRTQATKWVKANMICAVVRVQRTNSVAAIRPPAGTTVAKQQSKPEHACKFT